MKFQVTRVLAMMITVILLMSPIAIMEETSELTGNALEESIPSIVEEPITEDQAESTEETYIEPVIEESSELASDDMSNADDEQYQESEEEESPEPEEGESTESDEEIEATLSDEVTSIPVDESVEEMEYSLDVTSDVEDYAIEMLEDDLPDDSLLEAASNLDTEIICYGAGTSDVSAYNKILVYDQYGDGWSNTPLNYGATGGNNMENGGCHIFAYAHAIQWLTGQKVAYSDRSSLIDELIEVCDIPWGPTSYNSTDPQQLYNNHIVSKYSARKVSMPGSQSAMNDHFANGGVIIANPGGHYHLAVGSTYADYDGNGSNELYIHIVDSSCQSTWWRTNQNLGAALYAYGNHSAITGYSKNSSGGYVNGSQGAKWGGGEYWVTYSVFTQYRLDKAYLPGNYVVDKTAPRVTSAKITNITPNGYSVICEATDNISVQKFQIGTWNEKIGINAARWQELPAINGTATFTVSISDFNNVQDVAYHTNVYAFDSSGNVSSSVHAGDIILEKTPPKVTSATITNITSKGYDVICKATDNTVVASLQMGTWNDSIGIKAAHWQTIPTNDGTATFRIRISDYDNAQNVAYHTNIYAFDKCGNPSDAVRAGDIVLEATPPIVTTARIANETSDGYDVICEAKDNNKVTGIRIGTWHSQMSIDDAVWQEVKSNGKSTTIHVNIKDFKYKRDVTYYTNVYAVDICNNWSDVKRAGEILIQIEKPSEPAPAPAPTPAATQTIAAVKKTSKATVTAAPGAFYQLDLGGEAGKKFKSSKNKVATVDQNGLITIKGAGKAKITFKVGKKKRTLTLMVKDSTIPATVSITPINTAVKKGDMVKLIPVVPDGTNPGGYKWKSSNNRVAKVNNDGTVTFKKKGKVTITCITKRGKKKAKVKFTVSK